MTTKKLIRRQAYQAKLLSLFNIVISYILNIKNLKVDFLTCYTKNLYADDNNN